MAATTSGDPLNRMQLVAHVVIVVGVVEVGVVGGASSIASPATRPE